MIGGQNKRGGPLCEGGILCSAPSRSSRWLNDVEEWQDSRNNPLEFDINSQPLVGAALSTKLAHKKDCRLIRNPSKGSSAAPFPFSADGLRHGLCLLGGQSSGTSSDTTRSESHRLECPA